MALLIRDAVDAVNRIAPPHLKMGDDPTGLLVGNPEEPLTGIVVALDVTATVVREAQKQNANFIVAHHPLIYHPQKTIRTDHAHPGRVVMNCVRAGISVACAHACWDVADGGVNDVLADLCGLENTRPLQITYREPLVQIVVFVSSEARERVMNAMSEAGAGAIGNYDRCGFWAEGTGTFRPLSGANPAEGKIGVPTLVNENRLEMIAPQSAWPAIIAAAKQAHPYEEVAHGVYPLLNTAREYGIGRVGTLKEPTTAGAFLQHLQVALRFPAVRLWGPRDKPLRTVAVCGGAGSRLMPDAVRASADALVTSDVPHHEFIDAQERGFCLFDAGHAATESPGAEALSQRLTEALPGVPVLFVSGPL